VTAPDVSLPAVRARLGELSDTECREALLILIGSAQRSKPLRAALGLAVGVKPEPEPVEAEPEPVKAEPETDPDELPMPEAPAAEGQCLVTEPVAVEETATQPMLDALRFEALKIEDPQRYKDTVLQEEIGDRAFERLQACVAWCSSCGLGLDHDMHGGWIGEVAAGEGSMRLRAVWAPHPAPGLEDSAYPEPTLIVYGGERGEDCGIPLQAPDEAEAFARMMDRLGHQAIADLVRFGVTAITASAGGTR
jgi:hypothetical protein